MNTTEIVDGLLKSVASTEQFLDLLRQIGSYNFRKQIHLSDVELTAMIDENITAQLMATRDYYLMFEFIQSGEHKDAYAKFRDECMAEVKNRMVKGEVTP